MTQEEKSILLQDLCARLPYGVIVQFDGWSPEKLSDVNLITNIYNGMGGLPLPYLRPLSSMTEEEKEEMYHDCYVVSLDFDRRTTDMIAVPNSTRIVDWLNSRHFDHRGLIEKGLALPATEGMYNV